MIKVYDFEKYSKIIQEKLNLDISPVAVKLFQKKEDAKEILDKVDNNALHCKLIMDAAKGKSVYGTKNEIGCVNGAAVLGLIDSPSDLIEGNSFDKMNVTLSVSSGKHLIDQVPKMSYKIEAIGYAPLESAKFMPDVVVIVCKPKQMFDLIRANAYILGERICSSFGGTQSFCGDIVVNTYLTKKPTVSFGCMGSRIASGFESEEVVCGFPIETFDNLVESLCIVMSSND